MKFPYIKVNATDFQIVESRDFAKPCSIVRKDVHAKRNQFDLTKNEEDIFFGKIFEFAVYNYLKEILPNYVSISRPSITIYDTPSFDADIILSIGTDIMNINIKVQREDDMRFTRNVPSWLFQPEDRLFNKKCNELLIFGTIAKDLSCKIVSAGFVSEFKCFLDLPISEKLKKTKKAIYYQPCNKIFTLDTADFTRYILE